MTALVGLDIGTTGVKALALSPDGVVTGRAEEEYPLSTPRPGWAEQDPDDWVRAAEAALGRLGGGDASLGLSGQMHGLVVLDSEQRVLRPAILWNDQRTAAECAEIEERIGLGRLIELTGNRALPGFTAPKLLWLRRHEPEVYARIEHVLLPKDYVRLRLTGERATDAADASGTLLFDVPRRRWSEEVLDALEIPAAWLPAAYESPDVPAAPGAGDQAAAALGVGVDRPGPLSIVLGTSGVVFAALPGFAADRGGAGPRVLPRRSRRLACDGGDAVGCGVAALAARRRRRHVRRADRGGRAVAAGRRGADVPAVPPGGADAARRSECTRRVRRPDAAPRPWRARAGGARGRRLRPPGLARASARPGRRGGGRPARPAAAPAATSGSASLRPSSTSRSNGPWSRRDRRTAPRCSREWPRAPSPTCTRPWRPACGRRGRIEPEPSWREAYEAGYARFRALYPALRPLEQP